MTVPPGTAALPGIAATEPGTTATRRGSPVPGAVGPGPGPDLAHERWLLEGCRIVVGMDEVGRGALAGPVSVGAVAVCASSAEAPAGLDDSKRLTARRREQLCPQIRDWALAVSVGHASPGEIDRWGIVIALRLAGLRALEGVQAAVGGIGAVLLDGAHDWLTPGPALLAVGDEASAPTLPDVVVRRVVTLAKADRRCASVAAASVVAKCDRDEAMRRLDGEHPAYGWLSNKGYGSRVHLDALRVQGPSPQHRISWRLPG